VRKLELSLFEPQPLVARPVRPLALRFPALLCGHLGSAFKRL